MTKTVKIPEGYREDAKGNLVPETTIKPIDLERDALVIAIAGQAKEHSGVLATFKSAVLGQVAEFVAKSAAEYGKKLGGSKGNVTLMTFDGRYKLIVAQSDNLVFDERLQTAKDLIDKCIRRWSDGAKPEIMALVADAFKVDKAGNVSLGQILRLRSLNIEDATWKKAMEAIAVSVKVVSSKTYIRIYERDAKGEYQPISLDVASV